MHGQSTRLRSNQVRATNVFAFILFGPNEVRENREREEASVVMETTLELNRGRPLSTKNSAMHDRQSTAASECCEASVAALSVGQVLLPGSEVWASRVPAWS